MNINTCAARLIAAFLLAIASNASASTVRYVDVNGTNATPPFTDWSTAATNIQDAIDVADPGDQVLVANGVYVNGTSLVSGVNTSNRVAVTKALTLQSVNGPEVTVIQGYQVPGTTNGPSAVRCVYLTNGAVLTGFTLTNGATTTDVSDSGGGVWIQTDIHGSTSVVSNCVIAGNSAYGFGGGVFGGGTLNNCMIIGNWGRRYGGGVYGGASRCVLNSCRIAGNSTRGTGGGIQSGILNNCIVAGNWADSGGGVYDGMLTDCTVIGNTATNIGGGVDNLRWMYNSIVYFNHSLNLAPSASNYYDAPMAYCCAAPLASGVGNFTNTPLFVDETAGDYHLQTNSPCINAGRNASVAGVYDFDGNPRIVSGTVDIGAYEFQGSGSRISYAWLQQYGLPTDGSADFLDPDGDEMNNWQEWVAGTNPTNALSVLTMLAPTSGVSSVTVSWQSVINRSYWLDRASNLASAPAFSNIASNLAGQLGTTSYTDASATNGGPFFYRVGVQP